MPRYSGILQKGGSGATYTIAGPTSPFRHRADYIAPSTGAHTIIQNVINSLTSGRTWMETVKLVGRFSIGGQITLDSLMCLDLTEAELVLENGINPAAILYATAESRLKILGGEIDGNRSNNTDGQGIRILSSSDIVIDGVIIHDTDDTNCLFYQVNNFWLLHNWFDSGYFGFFGYGTAGNRLRNGVIQGNTFSNAHTVDGLVAYECQNITINGNVSRDNFDTGFVVESATGCSMSGNVSNDNAAGIIITTVTGQTAMEGFSITGGTCYSNSSMGLSVGWDVAGRGVSDITVTGVDFRGNTNNGIIIRRSQRVNIGNCLIAENGLSGIYAFGNTGADTCTGLHIHDNQVYENGNHGIQIGEYVNTSEIINNRCFNNANVSTGDGIYVGAASGNISSIRILGNKCYDDQGAKTQRYGVRTTNQSDLVDVENNDLRNNLTASALLEATNPRIRNNIEYVTENSGTATINSGSTSVVITHGLNVTPTVDDIMVNFAENPTSDPGNWWVDTITATQFTINVRNDPGASNLDLAWRAIVT